MHHMSGLNPNCCYSLVKLRSLTYVRTPQYSLQHPIFAYVRCGRTSRPHVCQRNYRIYTLYLFKCATIRAYEWSGSTLQFTSTQSRDRERSCPPALKPGPRYADSFMERMDLCSTFHAYINVASSNASIASSIVLRHYFGLGELEITDEERFRSPTATKWGEFEATAFDGLESSDKKLQVDLNRSADVLHPVFFTKLRSNAVLPSHSSVLAPLFFFAYFTSTQSLSTDRLRPSRTTHYSAVTGGLMEERRRVRP